MAHGSTSRLFGAVLMILVVNNSIFFTGSYPDTGYPQGTPRNLCRRQPGASGPFCIFKNMSVKHGGKNMGAKDEEAGPRAVKFAAGWHNYLAAVVLPGY
eukprot:1375345-Rhodomonas_salina.2